MIDYFCNYTSRESRELGSSVLSLKGVGHTVGPLWSWVCLWGRAVGSQFLKTNFLGYPFILTTWVTSSFSLALSGKSVQILSTRVSRVRATAAM